MIASTKVLLNVRSSKDFDEKSIVSVLPQGTEIEIKAKDKEWSELESGNFVRTEFLAFQKPQKKTTAKKIAAKEEK